VADDNLFVRNLRSTLGCCRETLIQRRSSKFLVGLMATIWRVEDITVSAHGGYWMIREGQR
jgi:hypothetical protein